MKKRLLVMLLLLCLLLTALTATVSAFTVKVNGEDVRITFGIDYHCDICQTYPPVNDDDYTINSFQAYTEDGKAKPLAEWKYGDGLVLSVSVKKTVCTRCTQTKISAGTFDVVVNAADVGYYCHKPFGLTIVDIGNYRFRFSPVDYLFSVVHHIATPASCEYDGYNLECWRCSSCGMCLDSSDPTKAKEIPDNVISKTGHKFDGDGVCTVCKKEAEAYIPTSSGKDYYATVEAALTDAYKDQNLSVWIARYARTDAITLTNTCHVYVNENVEIPEIRMSVPDRNEAYSTAFDINNRGGKINKISSDEITGKNSVITNIYNNSGSIGTITSASSGTQSLFITNQGSISNINIPDNKSLHMEVTNNGGTINTLTGYPENVALCNGTGSYGTITSTSGTADQFLNTGCYFYFPDGTEKWVNSGVGNTVSGVVISYAPFTVKVNRDGSALTATNGSYTIDGVNVGDNVALSAAFTLNPTNSGLTVEESNITSRWYYKGESKDAAKGKELTLDNIQYGVYDLIFEATESKYGFTTSVSVKVNVNLPTVKTAISLKTQFTTDTYTKVYDGTTNTNGMLPPIGFQLADEREIRISPDYYTATAKYKSPDCIDNNKIIVTVTLTPAGENYYTLTDGKIEVDAKITPYDGKWYDGVQHYKAFYVEYNYKPNDYPSIGKPVLNYLNLTGYLFDSEGRQNRKILTSEDGFQYSFYHLRPGAAEPDPELDELLTAASVFTYPEEYYYVYAVVESSLNYTGCITNSTSFFSVYDDKYNNNPHTHDGTTYTDWNGSSLSIASGGTATRYLSGAQPNVNVELALSQKKTLDLCLYNKAVHVIGSSYDQIYLVGGSTLVLSDCRKTGKVIGSAVASGSGGVAHVKNGTLSVYDVTLTGGIAKNGGAIVVDKDGTLNLYSGEISGNYVTGGNGGAIYIKSGGVVNMYGGTIRNNHAYSGDGGAIYVAEGGTLNLYGGEISGNTASGLGGGIYVEAGGMVTIQGSPIVTGNTANGKPSNLYICADSSNPLLTIDGKGLTEGAQIGVSTDASCPMLLARGTQTDYSAYFIPDDANTFILYNGTLTLCAKPTATLVDGTLTITTGSGYQSGTFVLFAAEYDADGRMLAVQSWDIVPEKGAYTHEVMNSGAKIKCFLLRYGSNTPVLAPFSPLA